MDMDVLWHSSAHVLAAAVKKLFPKAKLGIGPPVENGFYYDFEWKFSKADLEKIEEEMKKIIKEDLPFERKEISKKEAKKIFANERYKLELIDEIEEDKVTVYKTGDFIDLCKGPHIHSTGKIGAIKLLKLAGSYWKGNSKNPMLSRIYGISFETKKELDNFLELRKKAEEFDHRKIGKQLDLFSFHEEGPGLPFLHPKSVVIWNALVDFWRKEHQKRGYKEIRTPIILKKKLWEQSGHWEHYKDNMYFVKVEDEEYAIKPMNCPGAILVYGNRKRSYRELPFRLAELGLVHRHELSGVLSGLFRVRAFVQDDAHIFVTPGQVESEIEKIIDLVDYFYKMFDLKYEVKLSTKPEDAAGTEEMWEKATSALEKSLKDKKIKYGIDEGEGVFYGPKIDFHIRDSLGRTWQCATIQVDFHMPNQFKLSYIGKDGKLHRPVIIHRTIYGALERFMGILIEHYKGALPVWLSPVQVRIIPITDKNIKYADKVKEDLEKKDIRVEVDYSSSTLEYKIREAHMNKIPYIIIVGDKEEKNKTIAVRGRDNKTNYGIKIPNFLNKISKEIETKK